MGSLTILFLLHSCSASDNLSNNNFCLFANAVSPPCKIKFPVVCILFI